MQWQRGLRKMKSRAVHLRSSARLQSLAADALFASLTAPGRRNAFYTWLDYTRKRSLALKRVQLILAEWKPTAGPRRCWLGWVHASHQRRTMSHAIVVLRGRARARGFRTWRATAVELVLTTPLSRPAWPPMAPTPSQLNVAHTFPRLKTLTCVCVRARCRC